MNEAHQLLEKVMEIIAFEHNRIILEMKSGSVTEPLSQEEILIMATDAISKIAKLKRMQAMLSDVKTLFFDHDDSPLLKR
jgi:hypothetical protein